jgi:hypothetical protein
MSARASISSKRSHGDEDAPRFQSSQVAQRQFTHLAGADDEDGLIAEMVEDLTDVIDGGARYGNVAARDAGFSADALGDAAGVRKQSVQHRAGAGALLAYFVGRFDLAGDLAFADDEAVKTGGHAEQMAHGVGALVDVEVWPDFFDR